MRSAADDSPPKSWVELEEILVTAVIVETIAGFAVLAKPAYVVHLLFGPDAADGGIAQCFGIAMISLAIACWPVERHPTVGAARGLGVFSASLAVYLTGARTIVGVGGPLLWPAVTLHALIALLLVWKGTIREVSPLS